MHNSNKEVTTLGCFPLLRHLSYRRYRRLTDEVSDSGTQTIMVGKEKRVFHVDRYVLDTGPFRCLMELAKTNGNKKENCGSDCKDVIYLDLDAILFEHMLWLVSEYSASTTCDSNLMLDMRAILDFYSQ
ncbi:hypothetical protein FCM35_KLT12960 [Carex littledalei]|uniref:Uncharacterized protein n=1 Tax=Carex littledalei TaxID=544730 RepID=A0A833QNU2_9POAL|nr:hypothetical protein FCM35_KLT12960 [Carex littledalei]